MQDPNEDFRAYVDAQRKEKMRAVMVVTDTLPYAYTIGNACAGAPELLMIGSAEPAVRDMLHHLSRMLPQRMGKQHFVKLSTKVQLPVKLVEVDQVLAQRWAERNTPQHGLRIGEYHGERVVGDARLTHVDVGGWRLFQVLLPDPRGSYPGDANCMNPWSRVPALNL